MSKAVGLGKQVAATLARAWSHSAPSLCLSSDELAKITPTLIETGSGGLGWWRVRQPNLPSSPAALQLQQAYRLQILQAAVLESYVQQVVPCLRSAGVEPLLAKGWAASRLYPEPGLRPSADIDLYVRPEQHADAVAALRNLSTPSCTVDLHQGFPDLEDRTLDQLYGHSRLVRLGDSKIRILGPEDHLRHLCLHLLRHGAWRPVWLCDIGAAIEYQPADFDWDYFQSGDPRRSDWAVCAIGLAHQLLGARVEHTPLARRAKNLPRWLVPAVLGQWGSRYLRYTGKPVTAYLRRPSGVLQALRQRWPNPIEATVGMVDHSTNCPGCFSSSATVWAVSCEW